MSERYTERGRRKWLNGEDNLYQGYGVTREGPAAERGSFLPYIGRRVPKFPESVLVAILCAVKASRQKIKITEGVQIVPLVLPNELRSNKVLGSLNLEELRRNQKIQKALRDAGTRRENSKQLRLGYTILAQGGVIQAELTGPSLFVLNSERSQLLGSLGLTSVPNLVPYEGEPFEHTLTVGTLRGGSTPNAQLRGHIAEINESGPSLIVTPSQVF